MVVFPILLGSFLQDKFPGMVKLVIPVAPLSAVLAASLLACRSEYRELSYFLIFLILPLLSNLIPLLFCSVFSENVARIQSSMMDALVASQSSAFPLQSLLSGDFGAAILSVLLLHLAGFFVG